MTLRSYPVTQSTFRPLFLLVILLCVAAIACAGCTSSGAADSTAPTGSTARVGTESSTPVGTSPGASSGASSGAVGVGGVGVGGPSSTGSSSSAPAGNEGQTQGAVRPCPIASSGQVARSFKARSASFTTRTSALGNPLCVFTMTAARLGGRRTHATVTMTLDAGLGPRRFREVEHDVPNVEVVGGLADAAFYDNDTGTMQFLKGDTSVVVQATYRVRAGTRYAAAIKAHVIALCQRISADI